MRKLCFTSVLYFSLAGLAIAKDGYTYKFRVNGLNDTVVYLAHYYGPKMYYKDTVEVDAKGYFSFEGEDELPGGIYAIVMPDQKNFFEFIVNEPKFYMETDTTDLLFKMQVKGSEENALFYEYRKYVYKKNKGADPVRKLLKTTKDKDSIEVLREQLIQIDKDVKNHKRGIISKYPHTFLAKVFLTSADPKVPDPPVVENGQPDSLFKFWYFRNHYLDDVDFSDERLLRTPVFHNKIEYYLKKLTLQLPDSINATADFLVSKARANKEMFKYVVHYITSTYEKSKVMGMDAVFVYMAKNYYIDNQAFWMNSTKLEKLLDRAEKLDPLLMGKVAPNIILQDTLGHWHMLHQVKAKYTILYIWDPDCGHCKKETPKLKDLYAKYKDKDVEVFAPSTEFENKLWKDYLKKYNMPFINVSDSPEFPSNFRSVYDVFSTPVVYLLDKDKKILAKRLSVDQLEGFLTNQMERDSKDKKN